MRPAGIAGGDNGDIQMLGACDQGSGEKALRRLQRRPGTVLHHMQRRKEIAAGIDKEPRPSVEGRHPRKRGRHVLPGRTYGIEHWAGMRKQADRHSQRDFSR